MSELRFDGRVAVITGAGRGLGRSYARLLASRGARVIVNDHGVSLRGETGGTNPAEEVVREIRGAGGEAEFNNESVATAEGGSAIVQQAMDCFGRIDILIHNAGIVRRAALRDMSHEDFEGVLDVHLRGAFNVLRPAFPLMCDAGYGRIILTGSLVGLYGNVGAANYAAAKGGIHGLSCVAALEGRQYNVNCNVILPAAVTRMSDGVDTSTFPPMPPEWVAPAVAWLAHENCPMTGEMLVSAAGRVARAYVVETPGVYRQEWSIEEVEARRDAIRSSDSPIEIHPVPTGFSDHLKFSFDLAKGQR